MRRVRLAKWKGHYHFYTNAKTILSSQPELSYLNLTYVSHLGKLSLKKKKKEKQPNPPSHQPNSFQVFYLKPLRLHSICFIAE